MILPFQLVFSGVSDGKEVKPGRRKPIKASVTFFACIKCSQIEKILSTVFYAANYTGLKEAVGEIGTF